MRSGQRYSIGTFSGVRRAGLSIRSRSSSIASPRSLPLSRSYCRGQCGIAVRLSLTVRLPLTVLSSAEWTVLSKSRRAASIAAMRRMVSGRAEAT